MTYPTMALRRIDGFDVDALLTTEGQVITATGNSAAAVHVGKGTKFDVSLAASAIGGTSPTMDVVVRCASDAAMTADVETVATFTQVDDSEDPTEQRQSVTATQNYVDASWTLGGTTPTFTTTIALRS